MLSAWGTVDNFQLPGQISSGLGAMATDAAGNVYAAGSVATTSKQGIVREKLSGSSTWTTIEDSNLGGSLAFNSIAIDQAGDIYVGGTSNYNSSNSIDNHWIVLERPAGGSSFSIVDSYDTSGLSGAGVSGLAIDGAGNVFAVGQTNTTTTTGKGKNAVTKTEYYWTVRKQAGGQGAFTTVDNYQSTTSSADTPTCATAITSGASAALYVAGYGGSTGEDWLVRKSTDAGATWSVVDSFQYASTYGSHAFAVAGDGAGDVYVVGNGNSASSAHWLVRESPNGGASWSTVDDYQLSAGAIAAAESVGTDLAGNVYVVGAANDGAGAHTIIRTNASGSWATVDDYQLVAGKPASSHGFTVDPSGNLYAGGIAQDSTGALHWIVRSAAGPTAPAMATAASVFSSAQIASTGTITDLLHGHKRHRN